MTVREKAVRQQRINAAYDAGYDAHQFYQSISTCPFKDDGETAYLWDAWMNGFEQSEEEARLHRRQLHGLKEAM